MCLTSLSESLNLRDVNIVCDKNNKEVKNKPIIQKEFSISSKMDENKLKSILRETIVVNRIRGDNLFQSIQKYSIKNKTLIIDLEKYEQTLTNYKNNLVELIIEKKLILLKDLAFALDYLHLHLQSHKRLNPDNIYVRNGRLILGQLGFTCEVLEETNNLDYYPYEYHVNKEIDLSTDIFSLGCLFYEIITNKKAFNSVDEIIERKSVNRIVGSGSTNLDEMIYKMLDHDKTKRPKIRKILKFLNEISKNIKSCKSRNE